VANVGMWDGGGGIGYCDYEWFFLIWLVVAVKT